MLQLRKMLPKGKPNLHVRDYFDLSCLHVSNFVQDKSIKRFNARNMVDGSSKRDMKESSAYDEKDFYIPKIYVKLYYCISCACHARIVRVRSAHDRRLRTATKVRQVSLSF